MKLLRTELFLFFLFEYNLKVLLGSIVKKQNYEVIADGLIRAVFRINYGAEIDGQVFYLTDETSIWGGQYFYESRVSCVNFPKTAQLVGGLADFYDNKFGKIESVDSKIVYSYGNQSENKDKLGLGIGVHNKDFFGVKKLSDASSDIQNSYIVSTIVQPNKSLIYRFYAGWEKSQEPFNNIEKFSSYLSHQAVLLGKPQIVK